MAWTLTIPPILKTAAAAAIAGATIAQAYDDQTPAAASAAQFSAARSAASAMLAAMTSPAPNVRIKLYGYACAQSSAAPGGSGDRAGVEIIEFF
ncbi:MAG: hypothetical protein IVW56_04570 [Candidatus Binataceae bacterium]|nr:hypothetical protein [Candidatus Binataceae bacterium]